jgi:hypothetical protein
MLRNIGAMLRNMWRMLRNLWGGCDTSAATPAAPSRQGTSGHLLCEFEHDSTMRIAALGPGAAVTVV